MIETNLSLSIALYCLQPEEIDRHHSPSIKKTFLSIEKTFHSRSSSIEIFTVLEHVHHDAAKSTRHGLKQRERKGSAVTLEDMRAKDREDWLKLRQQHAQENSQDPHDRSTEKDQDAKPDQLSGRWEKGLDDDL